MIDLTLVQEFKEFLKEYKVIGLAVAFIMGQTITALVQSIVNNMVMPVVGVALPSGDWKTAAVDVGPVKLGIGSFISAFINFAIIAVVVFLIVKIFLKEGKPKK